MFRKGFSISFKKVSIAFEKISIYFEKILGSCFTLTAMLHDLYDLHALMAIHDFSYL